MLFRKTVPAPTRNKKAIITDPFRDQDDLAAFISRAGQCRAGEVELACVITNLNTDTIGDDRTRATKGLLNSLGLYSIPVGKGSNDNPIHQVMKTEEKTIAHYAQRIGSEDIKTDGNLLLISTFAEAIQKGEKIDVEIIGGCKDFADVIKHFQTQGQEQQLAQAIGSITIMGGYGIEGGQLTPDLQAYNHKVGDNTDPIGIINYFARQQNVTLDVVHKQAVYKAAVPLTFFDDLHAHAGESDATQILRAGQAGGIDGELWPSTVKHGATQGTNEKWFFKTFTNLDLTNSIDALFIQAYDAAYMADPTLKNVTLDAIFNKMKEIALESRSQALNEYHSFGELPEDFRQRLHLPHDISTSEIIKPSDMVTKINMYDPMSFMVSDRDIIPAFNLMLAPSATQGPITAYGLSDAASNQGVINPDMVRDHMLMMMAFGASVGCNSLKDFLESKQPNELTDYEKLILEFEKKQPPQQRPVGDGLHKEFDGFVEKIAKNNRHELQGYAAEILETAKEHKKHHKTQHLISDNAADKKRGALSFLCCNPFTQVSVG